MEKLASIAQFMYWYPSTFLRLSGVLSQNGANKVYRNSIIVCCRRQCKFAAVASVDDGGHCFRLVRWCLFADYNRSGSIATSTVGQPAFFIIRTKSWHTRYGHFSSIKRSIHSLANKRLTWQQWPACQTHLTTSQYRAWCQRWYLHPRQYIANYLATRYLYTFKQKKHIVEVTMNKLVNSIFRRNSLTSDQLATVGTEAEKFDPSQMDYKQAIQLLNQLQTNAECVKQAIEKERSSNVVKSLDTTRYFLSLLNITPDQLNQLNVVHVAGTKGKGSTCAFVEAILRHNGFKTGFYSSPHLVMARERIRINGEPISEEKFARYFGHVYNTIRLGKSADVMMPAYFHFLTVMALHIFLVERVDVAILEVGIGGEYDSTNVVPKPVVTGITSLDLDHCSLLGNTIEKIAWQKSGIFKEKVPAFTVKQAGNAMSVLRKRATEKKCPLFVAPDWSIYPHSNSLQLGDVQKINASLAVQLAHYWINKQNNAKHLVATLLTTEGNFADVIPLQVNDYSTALAQTKWFGRCEIITDGKITYFLDSAHTSDSMQNCHDWFVQESHIKPIGSSKNGSVIGSLMKLHHHNSKTKDQIDVVKAFRILVFNCTGERIPQPLLARLEDIEFDLAIFTTNSIYQEKIATSDVSNFTVTAQREKNICANNARTWVKINPKVPITKVCCITEAIQVIEDQNNKCQLPVHVLVTGSVHLVGGFIGQLHPYYCTDREKRTACLQN